MQGYPIGQVGVPWSDEDKLNWLNNQNKKRDYQELVLKPCQDLAEQFPEILKLKPYGKLHYQQQEFELVYFTNSQWQNDKPWVLVTGGVHGYETSGVLGAMAFAELVAGGGYSDFNFVIFPCVSPWGFETINRWNANAIDPNRSFYQPAQTDEAKWLMTILNTIETQPLAHFDLHETTDTDNTEFRPALAARDAIEQKTWNIPDGFYCVDDSQRPQPDFQKAVITGVSTVTHIADADEHNQLIGADIEQLGVINYDKKKLGLCGGVTDALFVTTTEVYPDSPRTNPTQCIEAQVKAITSGLDYLNQYLIINN